MRAVPLIFFLLGMQGSPASQPAAVTPVQLQAWLDQLGDPAYEVRQAAVERLYGAGPAALRALGKVSPGDDFEATLQAREIVQRIQKLFLVGAGVQLSLSQSTCRWDEPVSLKIAISNPNEYPVHLPFLTAGREQIDQDALSSQVGSFLDAADFLEVSGPGGVALGIAVDDYRGHPQVEQALDLRVTAEPASLLQPQARFELLVQQVNRGFARYRMLEQGSYRIRFSYVPEWDVARMRQDGVGQVQSNTVTLVVTDSAPERIRRSSGQIQADLSQRRDQLVVNLTNTHDRPMGVNLNLGGPGLRDHAHLAWLCPGEPRASKRWVTQPIPDAPPVSAARMRILQPAETAEIFSGDLAAVLELVGGRPPAAPRPLRLQVRYSNLLARATIAKRLDGGAADNKTLQDLYRAIPLPTFTGSTESPAVAIAD